MGWSPFAKPTAADFVPPIEKYGGPLAAQLPTEKWQSTGRGDFRKTSWFIKSSQKEQKRQVKGYSLYDNALEKSDHV